MEVVLAVVIGALYAAGQYMMLRRSYVKVIIGLALLSYAASLLIFTVNGVTRGSDVEPLAGKPKDELARKVMEFKQGKKPGTIMPQLAKGYTDEQIELMAGWFAAQPAK